MSQAKKSKKADKEATTTPAAAVPVAKPVDEEKKKKKAAAAAPAAAKKQQDEEKKQKKPKTTKAQEQEDDEETEKAAPEYVLVSVRREIERKEQQNSFLLRLVRAAAGDFQISANVAPYLDDLVALLEQRWLESAVQRAQSSGRQHASAQDVSAAIVADLDVAGVTEEARTLVRNRIGKASATFSTSMAQKKRQREEAPVAAATGAPTAKRPRKE